MRIFALLICLCLSDGLLLAQHYAAQVAEPAVRPAPSDCKSKHFLLHTDLAEPDAEKLLGRLEAMLAFLSDYWARPLSAPIECYVVADLKNWPENSLDAEGREKIAAGVGITLVDTESVDGKPTRSKAVVYSVANPGTVLHEVVHAYCGQSFHSAGPLWYAEGMAEIGQFWKPEQPGVQVPDVLIKFLRTAEPMTVKEIVAETSATGDSWRSYARRWAVCHLLMNNPNYAKRFQVLGQSYVSGGQETFDQAFGADLPRLDFEHRFFIEHLCQGFRADLCAWDWNKTFKPLGDGEQLGVSVSARRGWQPTGLTLIAGQTYEYRAKGTWQLSQNAKTVTAAGDQRGAGRLVGAVLKEWQLSRPLSLADKGSFQATESGNFFVRCADEWGSLGDNTGNITVAFRRGEH
jgi:hypothetical protein